MTREAASLVSLLAGRTRGGPATTRNVLLAAARWYLHQGGPAPRQTTFERELGLAVNAWISAVERGAPAVSRPRPRTRLTPAARTP